MSQTDVFRTLHVLAPIDAVRKVHAYQKENELTSEDFFTVTLFSGSHTHTGQIVDFMEGRHGHGEQLLLRSIDVGGRLTNSLIFLKTSDLAAFQIHDTPNPLPVFSDQVPWTEIHNQTVSSIDLQKIFKEITGGLNSQYSLNIELELNKNSLPSDLESEVRYGAMKLAELLKEIITDMCDDDLCKEGWQQVSKVTFNHHDKALELMIDDKHLTISRRHNCAFTKSFKESLIEELNNII